MLLECSREKGKEGQRKICVNTRQACNVAAPTRKHHKPTLTWPCRSVLSSIIAQVRQWTPSAKTGTIVNITYAPLQQTQLWRGRKRMRWVARISKDSWALLMTRDWHLLSEGQSHEAVSFNTATLLWLYTKEKLRIYINTRMQRQKLCTMGDKYNSAETKVCNVKDIRIVV